MIYLMLSAVALSFGLLGFLLNAFYFGKSSLAESLARELDQLRRILKEKERKVRETQEENAGCQMQIRLLESQLAERNEELNLIRSKALRREKELSRLQKISGNKHPPFLHSNSHQEPVPTAPPIEGASEQGSPLWRRELSNILRILDAVDKEANRK